MGRHRKNSSTQPLRVDFGGTGPDKSMQDQSIAAMFRLMIDLYTEVVQLRISQPPPKDDRIEEWGRWRALMASRGGIKSKREHDAEIGDAQPRAGPSIDESQSSSPNGGVRRAPEMVGDVDTSYMLDSTKQKVIENLL